MTMWLIARINSYNSENKCLCKAAVNVNSLGTSSVVTAILLVLHTVTEGATV